MKLAGPARCGPGAAGQGAGAGAGAAGQRPSAGCVSGLGLRLCTRRRVENHSLHARPLSRLHMHVSGQNSFSCRTYTYISRLLTLHRSVRL